MEKFLYEIIMDKKKGPASFFLKACLLMLSFIYLGGLLLIKFLYRIGILKRIQLPKPVISIGNITWGGVGKTPLVEMVARSLISEGLKPVILMRGYMDKKRTNSQIAASSGISDEALMLSESLGDVPVLVGSNRNKEAQRYLAEKKDVDIFILDDGFQHRKLHRDLEIVALDCMNPFGNKQLIPRGILREPISALQRAEIIVLTRTGDAPEKAKELAIMLNKIYPLKTVVESDHVPIYLKDFVTNEQVPLSVINGEKICSFCAIGNPDSFTKTLENLGTRPEKTFLFMDHYIYNTNDIKRVISSCIDHNINIIITTYKDYVKIAKLDFNLPYFIKFYILKIELEIKKGKGQFLERINRISHY